MNGRQTIREAIISRKMKHWALVACHPRSFKHVCPPWRARKNFWRLLAKYPQIAAKLGVNETSVYEV